MAHRGYLNLGGRTQPKKKGKKRNFFAQTAAGYPGPETSAYFYTLDEARYFLKTHGGGTIKDATKRAKIYYREIEYVTAEGAPPELWAHNWKGR